MKHHAIFIAIYDHFVLFPFATLKPVLEIKLRDDILMSNKILILCSTSMTVDLN